MMNRLYDVQIGSNGVELVEQEWYRELRTWNESLSTREGGEMSIVNEEVSINSKTIGGAMSEVRRETPERYNEIQTEIQTELSASQEFSFLVWGAET